jgi:hypothetical protein
MVALARVLNDDDDDDDDDNNNNNSFITFIL